MTATAPPPLGHETEYDEYYEPPIGPGPALKIIVAVVGVLVAAGALFLGAQMLADAASPDSDPGVTPGIEVALEVPVGASARTIGALLEEQAVIARAGDFERAVRDMGAAGTLRAGAYVVITGTPVEDLVTLLSTGPPAAETYRVTVIEGLRIEEMLQSLAEQTSFGFAEFADPLINGDVSSTLLPSNIEAADETGLTVWEGLLAPDTYEFVVDATPVYILTTMAATLERRVNDLDWSILEPLGLTPYDGLIIASLIEKEAKLDEDRPLIASVITNRLELGMALQIDATIIYALGENTGRVLLKDLEVDSPYNTYRNAGLPPTPIGGVRTRSLVAAASPAETEYLYYVLVNAEGGHGFSETLAEHNEKKAKAKADGIIP